MTHSISLIGGGSTTIGFLLEILALIKSAQIDKLQAQQLAINIFEESSIIGAGRPYDLSKTGFQNISNIRNNSGTLPQSGADFLQWLSQNRQFVSEVFDKFFEQRLAEKIARNPNKEEQFRASYETITSTFKERYLNLGDSVNTYHPRILYGIYRVALFEKIIEELRAAGVEINLHNKSKVVDFNKNPHGKFALSIKKDDSQDSLTSESDFVLFAAGMVEKSSSVVHENFLRSQWPEENLIAQVKNAVKTAKEAGLSQVAIGIFGSSLSAVEAVRTVFCEEIFNGKSDFELDGIKVKIDLLSRDCRLPKVRAAYAPFDYKAKGGQFPDISILEKAKELRANGQIHLWQILQLTAKKMAVFYRHFGHEEQALKAESFAKFIDGAKENYPAILQEFAKLEKPETFEQLDFDIKKAQDGDMGKLLGYQVAYGLIAPARREILDLLSEDEKEIYQEYFSTLHNLHDSPMPIPIAQELLYLHKKGLVDAVKLGHEKNPLEIKNDKFAVTDEEGRRREYDVVVRADGYLKDLLHSENPLHQKIAKQADDQKVFAPYHPGIGVAAAQEFGARVADKVMSAITGIEMKKTPIEIAKIGEPRQVIEYLGAKKLSEKTTQQIFHPD